MMAKKSKTQLAPSVKVCSLVSFSILTGNVRLCRVIPRQTTSKQKELTLFTKKRITDYANDQHKVLVVQ